MSDHIIDFEKSELEAALMDMIKDARKSFNQFMVNADFSEFDDFEFGPGEIKKTLETLRNSADKYAQKIVRGAVQLVSGGQKNFATFAYCTTGAIRAAAKYYCDIDFPEPEKSGSAQKLMVRFLEEYTESLCQDVETYFDQLEKDL